MKGKMVGNLSSQWSIPLGWIPWGPCPYYWFQACVLILCRTTVYLCSPLPSWIHCSQVHLGPTLRPFRKTNSGVDTWPLCFGTSEAFAHSAWLMVAHVQATLQPPMPPSFPQMLGRHSWVMVKTKIKQTTYKLKLGRIATCKDQGPRVSTLPLWMTTLSQ